VKYGKRLLGSAKASHPNVDSEQEIGVEREMRGRAQGSPNWWLPLGSAAEANGAANMSSRRIMANQPKSGSESDTTADDSGSNGLLHGTSTPDGLPRNLGNVS
jgi:hypothetical protein